MNLRPVACAFRLAVMLCLVCTATAARADLASALADFEAGRYESAAREFERLAWHGLAQAQSNVARLYASGQGVARSPGKAAAWAGIAAQSGDPKARELYLKILPMLGSVDVDESVALERAYQAVALELQVNFDARLPVGTPAKLLSKIVDIYPPAAVSEGWEGYVYLLVGVDEQGKAQDAQVLISAPPGKFDAATVEALLGARWEPASFEGRPVAAYTCVRLLFQFSGVGDTQGVAKMVRQLRERADGGDAASQFAGAVLWLAYPDAANRISEEEAQRWMVAALEAKFPPALMMTVTCGVDSAYGERAREIARSYGGKELLMAARRGSPAAQLLVARELLAAEQLDLAARTRRAIGWLELAEAGPQPWEARILLAYLLATAPVAELRDPARARSLYQPLRRTWGFHPLMKDTAAALK
jgi:TonB family protein